MAKAKREKNGVWFWELYRRFGYDLKVFGQTREEVVNAMSEEYIKSYAKWNDLDEARCRNALTTPEMYYGVFDEFSEYNEFADMYKSIFVDFNDGEPDFYEFGKVAWE